MDFFDPAAVQVLSGDLRPLKGDLTAQDRLGGPGVRVVRLESVG